MRYFVSHLSSVILSLTYFPSSDYLKALLFNFRRFCSQRFNYLPAVQFCSDLQNLTCLLSNSMMMVTHL